MSRQNQARAPVRPPACSASSSASHPRGFTAPTGGVEKAGGDRAAGVKPETRHAAALPASMAALSQQVALTPQQEEPAGQKTQPTHPSVATHAA